MLIKALLRDHHIDEVSSAIAPCAGEETRSRLGAWSPRMAPRLTVLSYAVWTSKKWCNDAMTPHIPCCFLWQAELKHRWSPWLSSVIYLGYSFALCVGDAHFALSSEVSSPWGQSSTVYPLSRRASRRLWAWVSAACCVSWVGWENGLVLLRWYN